MNRAVVYARVSTEDQANNGISLDAQVSRCLEYLSGHNLELLDTIIDAGISGKSTERPGLHKMLKLIEKRKIQHIITLKLDRLSRSTLDSLRLIEVFSKKGIQLHLVAENGSVSSDNADDEFMLTLKAGIAQLERKKISERTRFALNRKRQLGERISLYAPFGYRFQENNIVPDLQEQKIISRIHKLRSKGLTIRAIIQNLNRNKMVNRNGNAFGIAAISRIITKNKTRGDLSNHDYSWRSNEENEEKTSISDGYSRIQGIGQGPQKAVPRQ